MIAVSVVGIAVLAVIGASGKIPTDELRTQDLPPPDAPEQAYEDFALSFDGYKELGSLRRCGKIANAGDRPVEFWILVGLVVLGELLPISVARRNEDEEISTSTIFAFALMLTGGLAAAVLALALASLLAYYFRSRSLLRSSFGVAHYTLAITASAGVLELLSDVPHANPPYFSTTTPRAL